MLIRRKEDITPTPVQMEGVKDISMRLMIGREDGAPNFALRHFTVSPGGHSPRHSHNYEHEVIITAGEGQVEHDGEKSPIRSGDILFVEPNKVHQFVNQGDSPLEFLCLVPVSFDCGTDGVQQTPGS